MSIHENIQIHRNLILRDNELFHRKNGIGFFHKEIYERIGVPRESNGNEIWLPDETQEVINFLEHGVSVLIEGKFSSGKSALLYGIRSTARNNGYPPYTYFDGHYNSTSVKKIDAQLSWAQINHAWVVWDSLDYLVVSSRQFRKISTTQQMERSNIILSYLEQFIEKGGIVVATSHDPGWFKIHGINHQLQEPFQKLKSKMYHHTVKGRLDTEAERIRFYNLSLPKTYQPAAHILVSTPDNLNFSLLLNECGIEQLQIVTIIDGLKSYAIAKIICLDNHEENKPLLDLLINPKISLEEKWCAIASFVIIKQRVIASETAN